MTKKSEKVVRPWLINLLLLVLVIGLLAALATPNFSSSRPRTSQFTIIVNNLRNIDGAKAEWALEHGLTNDQQVAEATNVLTEMDLQPYFYPDRKSLIQPVAGEVYTFNALNQSPEAKLTQKIDRPYPKGSIVRFSRYQKDPNCWIEIELPDGTKIYTR